MNFVRLKIICGVKEKNLLKGSDIQMKFYDKEIYRKSEAIKVFLTILVVFMFGFALGYFICNYELQQVIEEKQNKINEQYVELDSLRETVYIYQMNEKNKTMEEVK